MARSFQLVNIFPQLSVRETIAVAAISSLGMGGRVFGALRKNRGVWEIVERVAGLFGFSSKLEQPAKSLSQGDKKLLDVASAFALNPEIILLDEPTSGVSTAEKSTIMQVLVRAAKETGIKAIIQVEHDMDIVFGYSSRIIAVHDGKILADGSPEMIRARSDVMATIVGRP
jgi:branched-chain amino acid transport system ATP-binding protein